MTTKTLNELLHWRYATKKMDAAKSVPQEKVDAILEAIRMAPTSSGTQPFEMIVVTNPEVRSQIAEAAGGQAQITDGSHLLVFAAWDNYTADRIDEVVQLNIEARGDLPMLHAYYDNLKANYIPREAKVNYAHAARQRSEEHTSELQSRSDLVCSLLLENKRTIKSRLSRRARCWPTNRRNT